MRRAAALIGAVAASVVAAPALADPSVPAAAAPSEAPRPAIVRVGLSELAAEKMVEARLRRLLELELAGAIELAPRSAGPLDENAVRVWVDLPTPSVVVIQVQAPGRRIEARRVDVAGLAWDVATRFVAIATSESVRGQLVPLVRKRPRAPSQAELVAARRAQPTLGVSGGLVGAWVDPAEGALLGSRLELSFHQPALGEHVSLTALGGTAGGALFELGVGAAHRPWLGVGARAELGASVGLGLGTDLGVEGRAPWLRATGRLGLEVAATEDTWLAVRLEPGVAFDAAREEAGPWLGGALAITLDAPVPRPTQTARR